MGTVEKMQILHVRTTFVFSFDCLLNSVPSFIVNSMMTTVCFLLQSESEKYSQRAAHS